MSVIVQRSDIFIFMSAPTLGSTLQQHIPDSHPRHASPGEKGCLGTSPQSLSAAYRDHLRAEDCPEISQGIRCEIRLCSPIPRTEKFSQRNHEAPPGHWL